MNEFFSEFCYTLCEIVLSYVLIITIFVPVGMAIVMLFSLKHILMFWGIVLILIYITLADMYSDLPC